MLVCQHTCHHPIPTTQELMLTMSTKTHNKPNKDNKLAEDKPANVKTLAGDASSKKAEVKVVLLHSCTCSPREFMLEQQSSKVLSSLQGDTAEDWFGW